MIHFHLLAKVWSTSVEFHPFAFLCLTHLVKRAHALSQTLQPRPWFFFLLLGEGIRCNSIYVEINRSSSPSAESPVVGWAGRTSENNWRSFDSWWGDRARWCRWDAARQSTSDSSNPQLELQKTEKVCLCSRREAVFFFIQEKALTNAEEKQGLHAEELLLSDLQQKELLWKMSHPYAVLVHGGDVHPVSAGVKRSGWELWCDGNVLNHTAKVQIASHLGHLFWNV